VRRRPFRYHKAAESELEQAVAWYDQAREGLGAELLAAIEAKVDRILRAPERWPRIGRSRRAIVGRFPYVIVYRERPDGEIEIVAIAHTSRRQGYWGVREP
jgi:toxin ParE1/3/4